MGKAWAGEGLKGAEAKGNNKRKDHMMEGRERVCVERTD